MLNGEHDAYDEGVSCGVDDGDERACEHYGAYALLPSSHLLESSIDILIIKQANLLT